MTCSCLSKARGFGLVALRAPWLIGQIVLGAVMFRCCADRNARALWLHRLCRRLLRVFGVRATLAGRAPTRGMLVANHLGYLDIVLLASLNPCIFIAKSEVRSWPVLGWFARMAGTIFIDRASRCATASAVEAIRSALRNRTLVVLFAEGTSSDGAGVLPFKSSLLEAAIGERLPLTAAAIRYELADGNAAAEACYWGNHTLVPHLLNLLSKQRILGSVALAEATNTWRDRKKLAAQLHSEVKRLHGELQRSAAAAGASELASPGRSQSLAEATSQALLRGISA